MEVKPGFKQSAVGVIPEDWDDSLLDKLAKRGSGHTPNKLHPEYWNGTIEWISLADSPALDQIFIHRTSATVTPGGIAHSSAVVHPAGTVVLSRDAGVGKSAIMGTAMAVSQHFMAWTCGPELDNRYLYYWLQFAKPQFERIANGTTIKTIGLQYFKDLRIPNPPLPEQRAIATVLSDVDALLSGLDRQIAKKRDLRRAAIQQLLSGQTRLPGFRDEWGSVEFGDIATIRNTKVIASSTPIGTQSVELEFIEQGSGRLLASVDAMGAGAKYQFRAGDVLFGRLRAYLRKYWVATFDGICSTEIWPLVARDKGLCGPFLHLLVQTDEFLKAAGVSYGTHMPRSDWSVLEKLPVQLPSASEQGAIATVLSDMDAELRALQVRRDKTRDLKQAMMQELLTGKTRLLSQGVAVA